jgi:hypothetical protein
MNKRTRIDPTLVGIFGRPAGSVEDFKYSDAMKESGVTWDEQTVAAYIADPKGYIQGNKMASRRQEGTGHRRPDCLLAAGDGAVAAWRPSYWPASFGVPVGRHGGRSFRHSRLSGQR